MNMEHDLAPGFRFFPTEEELVSFYLNHKLRHQRPDQLHRVIPEIDIYELHPSQLPECAGELCRGDTEQWFFFVPRRDREAQGGRPNRTTASGYWKATGSPGYVYSSSNRPIGVKKTMVFYTGKAPNGTKTKWKMNEYRAIDQNEAPGASSSSGSSVSIPKLRHEYSVCRVYVVSGNFRAFDRRPSGSGVMTTSDHLLNVNESQVVLENEPNMMTRFYGEMSLPEASTAVQEASAPNPESAADELNLDCLAELSWDQLNWL